ncbi:iron uptake system component EfeO [Providencia alcalifaciens]|nr:iron uptake system component EfeO [Providencia alcalifaciens]
MRNSLSYTVILLCGLFLIAALPFSVSAKALRSPVQEGDDIIIAKGDIPTPEKYQPAIKAYLDFTQVELSEMVSQLEILKSSLTKDNLNEAERAYIQAHQHYETIRPIIMLFGNTDRILNARADYFLEGEKDYRFTGFHLVEYQLFDRKETKAALVAVDELLMKARDLQKRVATEHIEIPKLVQASADFIEMILETKLSGKENVYSQSDITDIAANLRGSEEVIRVIKPFIDPNALKHIQQSYRLASSIIQPYQLKTDAFEPYSQFSKKDKMALYSVLTQQAENLALLRYQLSVDVYYKY